MISLFSLINPVWPSIYRIPVLDLPPFLLILCPTELSVIQSPEYHCSLNSVQPLFHSDYKTVSSIMTLHRSI